MTVTKSLVSTVPRIIVAAAMNPSDRGSSAGADHAMLMELYSSGRLVREAGDALCQPRGRFWGLLSAPGPDRVVTCKRCREIADDRGIDLPGDPIRSDWPIGTLFPIGRPPHTPTMCQHRTFRRNRHRTATILCYKPGLYEVGRPDGSVITIATAYGQQPWWFCDEHVDAAVDDRSTGPSAQRCASCLACQHDHWRLAAGTDLYDTCERCGVNRFVSERR